MSSRDKHLDNLYKSLNVAIKYDAFKDPYLDEYKVKEYILLFIKDYLWDLQDKTAIGEISERAEKLMDKLHGRKMDGPRNETTRTLSKIIGICDNVISGKYEYNKVEDEE